VHKAESFESPGMASVPAYQRGLEMKLAGKGGFQPGGAARGGGKSNVVAGKSNIAGMDEKSLTDKIEQLGKATTDKKNAKKHSRNKDTIATLMESLDTKPKFTKMVEYSVECMKNLAIDEASVEEMINEGVLETLMKVLKLNPYNEKIQRIITKTLEAFAINERMAALMSKKMGAAGFVFSMKKHVEPETLESTTKFVAKLMRLDPQGETVDTFIKGGAIGAVAQVIGQSGKNLGALQGSVEMLDHIAATGKKENGIAIMETGVMENVLQALTDHPDDANLVEHAVGLIANLAKMSPEIMQQLKKLGAVDILVAALEHHPDNERILELGANALSALAGADDLGAALSVNVGNNLATARAISKLSSLMLVPENVEYMAKNQGVGWLVSAIKQAVGQPGEIARNIVLSGTRALARMATDENKIYGIMQAGGVKLLISVMQAHAGDEEAAAAALMGLTKMTTRKENAVFIMKSGGVEAALAILKAHPDSEKVAKQAADFFQRLATHADCVPGLIEKGVIPAMVDLLSRHHRNPEIAHTAINALGRMAVSAENMQKIAEAGGLEAIVATLQNHPDKIDVAKQAMLMIESAAMLPVNIEPLRKAGAVDAILGAIEAHPEDAELQEIGSRTLAMVAGKGELKKAVGNVSSIAHAMSAQPSMAAMHLDKMGAAVRLLGNLALVDSNVDFLVKNGAVESLCNAFNALSALPPSEKRAAILKDAAAGLLRLATNNPEAARTIVQTNALKNMLRQALLDPENEELAEYATRMAAICATDPANIDKMIADGAIEDIIALAKAHPLNEKVLANATRALGLLAKDEAAVRRIIAAGGAEVVVESLFANMDNPEALLNALQVLSQLAHDENAIQALVDAGAIDAILEAMRKHPDNPEILKACISALCSLMISEEIANQVGEKGGIPLLVKAMRDHFKDEGLCEVDMVLCDSLASVQPNVDKFLAEDLGTVDLVKWVGGKYDKNHTIEEAAAKLLAALLGPPKKEEKKEELAKMEMVHLNEAKCDALMSDMRGAGMEAAAKQNMLSNLCHILQDPNNARMMVQKGGLQALAAMMKENKDDEGIFYNASSAFLTLLENGGEAAALALEDPACIEALCHMMNASERFATPMNLADLTRAIAASARLKLKPASVKEMMKNNPLGSLMKIMVQSDDPMLLAQAAKLLGKLSNNEDASSLIAHLANIRELINAMRRNIKNEEFLQYGVYLLGNLGNHSDELKGLIGIEGGIQLILQIMQTYPQNRSLIENCCYALANLSFNNAVNCSFIVACKGIQSLISVMSTHQKAEDLLESAVCVLCNLCHNNDPNKEEITKHGGAQSIVDTILNNFDALELLTTCFRALGNLAYNKKNISMIIRAGGVQGIVAGMTVHNEELDIIDIAIRVLTNLAADPDEENMAILAQEGAVQAVVEVATQYFKNIELEIAALGCLCNLARTKYNAEMVVKQAGTEATIEAMRSSNYEPRLTEKAIRLDLALSVTEKEKDRMIDAGIIPGFVAALKAHSKNRAIVGSALNTIHNLCYSKEAAIKMASDESGIIGLTTVLLKSNIKDAAIVTECYKALGALARADQNAIGMSDLTMQILVQTYAMHTTNAQVIAAGLRFLTNLCVHKECAEKVPAAGIVGATLGVISQHASDPAVLVRGCKALENMAFGSANVRDHMKKEGVLQAMKEIMTQNASRDDVKRAAQAVVDALNRMDQDVGEMKFTDLRPRIDKKKDAKSIFGKDDKEQAKVLSQEIRNLLTAGALITKHSKTAPPRPKHVYVDHELKFLIWKDPKDKSLKEENMMKVYKIKTIDRGRMTPQLQRKNIMGKFLAKEECAFTVVGRERTVDLEASSEAEREKWIHALETLIEWKKGQKLAQSGF